MIRAVACALVVLALAGCQKASEDPKVAEFWQLAGSAEATPALPCNRPDPLGGEQGAQQLAVMERQSRQMERIFAAAVIMSEKGQANPNATAATTVACDPTPSPTNVGYIATMNARLDAQLRVIERMEVIARSVEPKR